MTASTSSDQPFRIFKTPCGLSLAHLAKAETTFAYKEIFQDKIYFQHGITLGDGDCVLDVGANIGLFSVFVHENYRNITTISFEPSPEVFPLLKHNIARYGERAVAYPFGLAQEEAVATFTYYPDYSILSGFHAGDAHDQSTLRTVILNQWRAKYPQQDDPEERFIDELVQGIVGRKTEYQCSLRPLSAFLSEHPIPEIALLKIDAEGSELDILAGIAPADWPRIRQFVIEVHDPQGTQAPKLRELLDAHQFESEFQEESQFRSSGISNCYAWRKNRSNESLK